MPQRSLTFRHKGAISSVQSKLFFDYKLNLLSYSYKKIANCFLRCIPVGIYSKLPFPQVRRLTPPGGTGGGGGTALPGYQRVSNSRVEVFERVAKYFKYLKGLNKMPRKAVPYGWLHHCNLFPVIRKRLSALFLLIDMFKGQHFSMDGIQKAGQKGYFF